MWVENNCVTVRMRKGKITCQFMIWWRLMGCMVRPGWPLQERLQLCPQAVVRLLLAQTDLSAHCGIFPHQHLQAITPLQVKAPTSYYCHQGGAGLHVGNIWGVLKAALLLQDKLDISHKGSVLLLRKCFVFFLKVVKCHWVALPSVTAF